MIVASEGIRGKDNKPINFSSLEHSHTDQFGHIQLGGVAATLANLINTNLKFIKLI